jgi:hypothetical protein
MPLIVEEMVLNYFLDDRHSAQNPSKEHTRSWGLISTLDIWYHVSRTILRTFGDLDNEHKGGGGDPDFSPLLL